MTKNQKLKLFENYSIYGITDSKFSKKPLVEQAYEMIKAGIKIVQYREKYADFKNKYYDCVEIKKLAKKNNVIFIINDHPDLALMVKADGIHLGQEDYPVKVVRKLVGNDMIIGISTHEPKQYIQAAKEGADYAGVGPLFKTQTKDNVMDPVGLDYLRWVIKHKKIPFVAIGGIKEHNIDLVIKEGAKCICLVTEITTAKNIKEKVKSILNHFPIQNERL